MENDYDYGVNDELIAGLGFQLFMEGSCGDHERQLNSIVISCRKTR